MIPISAVWVVFFYGVFLCLSGLMGYWKGNSWVSLLMGGASGILLLVCAFLMRKQKRWAAHVALLLTSFLTLLFLVLYLSKGRLTSGILALLSAIVLFFLFIRLTRWKK
jgi:uncharacterized membrane protein (UPF0136 family)